MPSFKRSSRALATLAFAMMGSSALHAASANIVMTGVVHTRCEASFTRGEIMAGGKRIDLGLVSRTCNDGSGYRMVLHTPAGLTGAMFVMGTRQIPLSESGATVLIDSNDAERTTEPAYLQFAKPVLPGTFDLRIEMVAKGPIY